MMLVKLRFQTSTPGGSVRQDLVMKLLAKLMRACSFCKCTVEVYSTEEKKA
jgi:hypothetical protein